MELQGARSPLKAAVQSTFHSMDTGYLAILWGPNRGGVSATNSDLTISERSRAEREIDHNRAMVTASNRNDMDLVDGTPKREYIIDAQQEQERLRGSPCACRPTTSSSGERPDRVVSSAREPT